MVFWCPQVIANLGAALAALALAGCATPPPPTPLPAASSLTLPSVSEVVAAEPSHPVQARVPAAKDSGMVLDQTLVPRVLEAPLKQTGRASWYGKNFNGRRTASGERFSAAGFTAAHRTLPFLSYVRVRRVASGEEVIVRITDRGPFHAGRVLDLSHAAAQRIGLVALGSAEVEIEPLTEHDQRLGNSP